ncbi:DUF5985 family protein [Luteolibacter arcticus]|uniref:DUF5985 family protein n=1 Tax=Luteolibacter arcticus TaxID=1581411 RepID=A0ABT3GER2_9BACT|nr:DUF5985 family protein [Luteolibacter arcticus]MCW1921800.1 DUF5985 family protein [Luteolibacter arcticus]
MIPTVIYILCFLTCAGCAALLWRGFRRTRFRLLLWSSVCFLILGIANLLLFADLVLYPGTSLLIIRNAVTLVAILVLLVGLVFESH